MHFPLHRGNQVALVIYWIAVYFVKCIVVRALVNGIVWHAVIGHTSSACDIVSTSMAARFAFCAYKRVATTLCISFAVTTPPPQTPLRNYVVRCVTEWYTCAVMSLRHERDSTARRVRSFYKRRESIISEKRNYWVECVGHSANLYSMRKGGPRSV